PLRTSWLRAFFSHFRNLIDRVFRALSGNPLALEARGFFDQRDADFRTQVIDWALGTARRPRGANAASVEDEQVRAHRPPPARDEIVQVLFDPDGIRLGGEAESPGEPSDVGVDDEPLVDAEGIPQDDVGGLT